MNTRRKQILKELGLTPVWHLKSAALMPNKILESQSIEINNLAASPDPAKDLQRPQEIQQMNWEQLKLSVSHCTACPLSQARTQTVFGVGDENADWLFVGEGPGAREDATGKPFVGPAGKLRYQMLAANGLKPEPQV